MYGSTEKSYSHTGDIYDIYHGQFSALILKHKCENNYLLYKKIIVLGERIAVKLET